MSVKNPKPLHPGRVLEPIFMQNHGFNQTRLAEKLGCTAHKILFLALFFAIGCATTTVDQSAFKQIKRVAIVGFSGKIREDGTFSTKLAQNFNDQHFAPRVYKVAQSQLMKSFRWTFVSAEEIRKNADYSAHSNKKSSKVIELFDRFGFAILHPSILSSTNAAAVVADLKFRQELMKKLKVDALMMLQFDVKPQKMEMNGLTAITSSSPLEVSLYNCTLTINVYNRQKKDPIWTKHGIEGENANEPTLRFFGITFPNQRQSAVVSSFLNAIEQAAIEVKEM